MSGAVATRVRAAVEPVLQAAGFDVEDVAVRAAGKRHLVQVVVDRDGGLTLDDVADASRAISTALDESDPIAGPYVLEVTSPGAERVLTQPRHWRRSLGRLVAVRRRDGTTFTGRLTRAGDDGADLLAGDQSLSVAYADVTSAKVQVEI